MGMAMKVAAPLLLGAMVMASVASTDVASAGTFNPALTSQHDSVATPVWWRGGWGRGWGYRGWGYRGWGYRGWGYRGWGYRVGYGWGGHRWCYWHPRACRW